MSDDDTAVVIEDVQLAAGGDDNARVAALEEEVKDLRSQLQATKDELTIFKSALANVTRQVEELGSHSASAPRRSPARPRSAQPGARRTPAKGRTPAKTGGGSARKRQPGSAKRTAASPGYGTLPKRLPGDTGPKAVRTRKQSQDDTAVPKKSKPKSKRTHVSKIFAPAVKEDTKDDAPDIDPNRKGNYNACGKKIYYVLPDGMSKADAKDELPDASLKLSHTYGFNGKACRDNLYFNRSQDGEVIYSIAGTGVVYNLQTGKQRFFTEHNEDILCLAAHPTRPLVATGQLDPKGVHTPYCCIWDTATMECVKRITYHDHGIICLDFTPDGKYLLTVGDDSNHCLALWDWEKVKTPKKKGAMNEPLFEFQTSKDKIFTIRFNEHVVPEDDAKEPVYEFMSLGVKHLTYWTITNPSAKDKKARTCKGKKVTTMSKTNITQKAFHSVAFLNKDDWVVSTQSGHVYTFERTTIKSFFESGKGILGVVRRTEDGGYVAASDDGILRLYNAEHKEQGQIDFSSVGRGGKVQPRAVDVHNGKVIMGFKNNSAAQIDLETKEINIFASGHCGEVWALAIHPTKPLAATGAHDRLLMFWNTETRKADDSLQTLTLDSKVRSAMFSPDGKYLVVGLISGTVILFDADTMTELWKKELAAEQADAVAFSPDSSVIAVGSWDQFIYVLTCPEGNELHKLKGHTSSILMLNFSEDGQRLMSNSRDYEILYWDLVKGRRIKKPLEVADTKWFGWNCFLGWPVAGIWADCGDGTDINMVDRSPDESLLAAGDDFGLVRLFRYPVMKEKAQFKGYPGHSSHVPNVRFSPDGKYLMSAGGGDCGVFQWEVVA